MKIGKHAAPSLVALRSEARSVPSIRSGFSLIEFVGVMAVLAILAAMTAPLLVRQSDKGALAKEVSELSSISNALCMDIIRNKAMPDETTWHNVAANWMNRPAAQISTNARGYQRAFLIYNGGWLAGYPAGSFYSQSGTGLSGTNNARAMIVSTIATALPISSGRPTAADFNNIWNTPPLQKPSTWTTWNGSGADLTIQRFNVDPLFHRLILANRDNSTQPGFTIDSTSAGAKTLVVHNTGKDAYYLDGTVVSLWVGSTLTNSFVLTSDVSFTFNGGMWRAQLAGGSAGNGGLATNFSAFANAFISTPSSNNKGTDPQGLMTAFASFMYAYSIWANECPHFQTAASGFPQTTDFVILNAIAALVDKATGKTAAEGLLK